MPVYVTYPKKKNSFRNFSVNVNIILINLTAFILFFTLIRLNVFSIEDIAIKPANIIQGKYLWTFLTSMFMHGGFFHLFVNMFSLLFIGGLIEQLIGRKRYLWFYLISGLVAGLFFVLLSFVFPRDMDTFAVGASGALFGISGLMVILTPNLPLYVMFIPISIKAKYAIPGLLIILWLISFTGELPVGNTAHLGGLIAGLIYGIYLKTKYKRKTAYINRYFS